MPMMGFFDPTYLLFMIPGLLIGLWASLITKSTFAKYSRIGASTGLTGAEAARKMLRFAGIDDVKIERVGGFLTDHYDPSAKTLRLSPDVYGGASLSSIGVACHEAGHAIQHARSYAFLGMRTALVPVVNICSSVWIYACIAGIFFHMTNLLLIGVGVMSVSVLFSLVTLPVEWDASARAKRLMVDASVVHPQEAADAGRVLNAAFMTYVASAISSILMLLYFLLRSGLLGGQDD